VEFIRDIADFADSVQSEGRFELWEVCTLAGIHVDISEVENSILELRSNLESIRDFDNMNITEKAEAQVYIDRINRIAVWCVK